MNMCLLISVGTSIIVLASAAQAYQPDTYSSTGPRPPDTLFSGSCNGGGGYSGNLTNENYYIATGPKGKASSGSKDEAIKNACGEKEKKKISSDIGLPPFIGK